MLLELFQNLIHCIDVSWTGVFSVDKNVIKIYYLEDQELLGKNFINIALKKSRCICQTKKHDLVLKIAISVSESCFLFGSYLYLHLMVDASQIKLHEILGLA